MRPLNKWTVYGMLCALVCRDGENMLGDYMAADALDATFATGPVTGVTEYGRFIAGESEMLTHLAEHPGEDRHREGPNPEQQEHPTA